ncbi:hypothetical protein V8D89_007924 [Ganoderma adspersum]
MSPINLSNVKSVDSFHRFIFADEAARAPYIYGLKLPDPHLYGFGAEDPLFQAMNHRLVAILQAAAHLEYLYIPTTTLLDPVLTAAARMTSLLDLHIVLDGDRESSVRLLGTFRSPLRSLRIDKGIRPDKNRTSMKLLHDSLANFAPTLEVLELPDANFDISPSLVTTQFIAMRPFTTRFVNNFEQFMVETLLRLFPNLDNTLALGFLNQAYADSMEHDYAHERNVSNDAQMTRPWSGLRRLACDAELAFLMSLGCRFHRLDIRTLEFYDRRFIAPILRRSCPQLLQLSITSRFGDQWDNLDGLFPREGSDPLTHLVLFADFEIPDELRSTPEPLPWAHFQEKLITAIAHLRLTHLRVVYHYARPPVHTTGDTDLHTVMTGFFCAIPTLKCVLLTTCSFTYNVPARHRAVQIARFRRTLKMWLSSKAWRIADDHEDRHHDMPTATVKSDSSVVVALSREGAERVLDEEGLHLSRDKETATSRANLDGADDGAGVRRVTSLLYAIDAM